MEYWIRQSRPQCITVVSFDFELIYRDPHAPQDGSSVVRPDNTPARPAPGMLPPPFSPAKLQPRRGENSTGTGCYRFATQLTGTTRDSDRRNRAGQTKIGENAHKTGLFGTGRYVNTV